MEEGEPDVAIIILLWDSGVPIFNSQLEIISGNCELGMDQPVILPQKVWRMRRCY